jgi:raffinose/stachyose/melibiose transport system substrate-binding protein
MEPLPKHESRLSSRRDFLKSSLIGAGAATLLASCSSTSSAHGGNTELLVWYWGEQEAPGMQAFMEKAVAQYNAQQSRVKVTAVLQSSDTLYSAFAAAAEAGKGPDIQYLWGGTQALVDVWLGYCAPLSDYIDAAWLKNIPESARAQTYWGGKQWGLPFYQIGSALPYNRELFRAANLNPDEPPTTWQDFTNALAKLKKTGIAPIGAGFKDQFIGGWLVSYFGQQNFNSVAEAIAPFKGGVQYSGPKYTQWITQLKGLVDAGYFNNDVLSINLYQGQNLFKTRKAAIVTSVQPQITSFYRTMGGASTVGVMRAPAFGTGRFADSFGAPVQVLLITKFSPHKEEAAAFLKFLHTPDVMRLMYRESGAICPDTRFDPAWLNTETDKTMWKWQEEVPNFWYQYYYPIQFETNGVDPGLQKLWQPNGSVESAVTTMQAAIKQWRAQSPQQAGAFKSWQPPPD